MIYVYFLFLVAICAFVFFAFRFLSMSSWKKDKKKRRLNNQGNKVKQSFNTMASSTIDKDEVENQTAGKLDETDEARETEFSIKTELLKRENNELKKLDLDVNQFRDKEEEVRKEMVQWKKDKEELESIRNTMPELESIVIGHQYNLYSSSTEENDERKENIENLIYDMKLLCMDGEEVSWEMLFRKQHELLKSLESMTKRVTDLETIATKKLDNLSKENNTLKETIKKQNLEIKQLRAKEEEMVQGEKDMQEPNSTRKTVAELETDNPKVEARKGLNIPLVLSGCAWAIAAVLGYLSSKKRS